MPLFPYYIYGAFYNGKLVLISSSPDKNIFNFYPDENRIEVVPNSNIINHHIPLHTSDGLQVGNWFWIFGGNENDHFSQQSKMNTNKIISKILFKIDFQTLYD